VHHSIDLFQITNLNAQFLYSITIYMLHHNPRHVSSSIMLIFRRANCIITASGIVTLCKRHTSSHRKHVHTPNVMLSHHHIGFYIFNKF
jgi:hypothetical protein